MSAALLILVGAILCFLGAFSVRLAVLAAGFGTGWLLAESFDAATSTAVAVAVASAVAAFVTTLVLAKFLFFVAGVAVGTVVGSKLFVVLDTSDGDWLLAVVFVPATALLCGWLAAKWQRPFMRWVTAAAGAGLVLSGIGRLGADRAEDLWQPESVAGSALLAVLWLALTIVGHRIQTRSRWTGARSDERAR